MKIIKRSNYNLFVSENSNFNSFFSNFKKYFTESNYNNLIVEISENLNISKEEIVLFLDYALMLNEQKFSFVLIQNNIDVDEIDEQLNVVPTLQEAKDIIKMEAIERDLEF